MYMIMHQCMHTYIYIYIDSHIYVLHIVPKESLANIKEQCYALGSCISCAALLCQPEMESLLGLQFCALLFCSDVVPRWLQSLLHSSFLSTVFDL